jgi:hypothetical protein
MKVQYGNLARLQNGSCESIMDVADRSVSSLILAPKASAEKPLTVN